jgi:hypothetical protein
MLFFEFLYFTNYTWKLLLEEIELEQSRGKVSMSIVSHVSLNVLIDLHVIFIW